MKVYDISQEVFTCCVYPGDPVPKGEKVLTIAGGAVSNVTALSMCAHNGTHVDAPYHFFDDGKKIDEVPLEKLVGEALVVSCDGAPDAEWLEEILKTAPGKLLFKGNAVITMEAAKLCNQYGMELLGIESQSFGPDGDPIPVHLELLGKEVVLLEGIRLSHVPEGRYILHAAPLNLGGADGAPCRATLLEV